MLALTMWGGACGSTSSTVPLASSRSTPAGRPLAPDDRDLAMLVPAEAEVVMEIDMAQLRASRWSADVLTARSETQAKDARGFDEINDVDHLLYARLVGSSGASITILRGRFDREKVFRAFSDKRSAVFPGSFRGFETRSTEGESVALLGPRTVLAGSTAAVRAAIETATDRAGTLQGQRWHGELIDALDDGGGPGRSSKNPAVRLVVSVSPALREQFGAEFAAGRALEWVGLRLDLGQTLEIAFVGQTQTPREAAALSEQTVGRLRQLRNRTSVAALGLGPVLEGVAIVVQGKRVIGTLRLDEARREVIAERLATVTRILGARPPDSSRDIDGGAKNAPAPP